ncbi:TetR/AcrR family transcriptional regulator [Microbacterium sp. SSM24]|uniref:TetR/AcrR family transcriptional regulator n=1 Tax=Microbacterium sp. SSM24 TaxID=2991714 RepID=UPI0022263BFF|nr:TetR/AcrR family transcriptional regulator [Microbacterium sp. SSM24]MCW3492688.1 TetR/AcrR family transcriptional regulator [Microbacterium sp. SSM24]
MAAAMVFQRSIFGPSDVGDPPWTAPWETSYPNSDQVDCIRDGFVMKGVRLATVDRSGYGVGAMTDSARQPLKTRGPYRKTAQTRVAILEAALDVFSASGYHSGSLRDIAKRAGISHSGLLHHFPDKISLLDAMLDHRDEIDAATIRQFTRDSASALHTLVHIAAINASKPGIVKLYAVLSTEAAAEDHPAHQHFVTRYARTRELVREAFAGLADEDRLGHGMTPESAAIGTLAIMDGLQIQWLLDPAGIDMPQELAKYLSTITDIDFTVEPSALNA